MKTFLILIFSILNLNAAETDSNLKNNIYTDSDGDRIFVLDMKLRSALDIINESKATQVYDNQTNMEKLKAALEKNILIPEKEVFEIYTVLPGEQLESISQKIYGTTSRWRELQVLNENILIDTSVSPGMKLKYRKNRSNETLKKTEIQGSKK